MNVITEKNCIKTYLICTVGGSHQPVLKAISDINPDHTIFICSQDDKSTGQKGSYISVIGNGNVIKSDFSLSTPDLQNIVSQKKINAENYEVLKVPADDIDQCYQIINSSIEEIKNSQPLSIIKADYTGGTKTMSAALAMCAVDQDIGINLIVGTRIDHIKVVSGSEKSKIVGIDSIRTKQKLNAAAELWNNFAYHQAAEMAGKISITNTNTSPVKTFIQFSKAFDAWDKFDHVSASQILNSYEQVAESFFCNQGKCINLIIDAQNRNGDSLTPYHIYDVWNNAKRKAKQGYFDDAVSRGYRMLEMTAQWILLVETGWITSDLPINEIPKNLLNNIQIKQNRFGNWQSGLYATWQLIEMVEDSKLGNFIDLQLPLMSEYLSIRNNSILAHGFSVVSSTQWRSFEQWIEVELLPLINYRYSQVEDSVCLRVEDCQLPEKYPEYLL